MDGMPSTDDQPLPRPEAVDLEEAAAHGQIGIATWPRQAVSVDQGCEAPLQLEAGDAAAFLQHRPQHRRPPRRPGWRRRRSGTERRLVSCSTSASLSAGPRRPHSAPPPGRGACARPRSPESRRPPSPRRPGAVIGARPSPCGPPRGDTAGHFRDRPRARQQPPELPGQRRQRTAAPGPHARTAAIHRPSARRRCPTA